ETSIEGIFACGDIVSVEGLGNTKLLVTGFAQAAIAAGSAKAFIDPKAKIFGGHSSEILGKK
ncbi:MAG: ferredoxin--NADP(+) reductase, partial [candidate division WOR-3 bacterium]